MKYILLGIPKSGTTSFHYLFKQMGLKSVHWRCDINKKYVGQIINENNINGRELLTGLYNYDCITQMDVCLSKNINFWPQINLLEKLYEENKEIIFILNYRKPIHLLQSIKKWGDLYERILKYNEIELYQGENNDSKILNWIEDHYTIVEDFFDKKDNFIKYDIEQDNFEKIKNKLNIPNNIKKFPHKNKKRL